MRCTGARELTEPAGPQPGRPPATPAGGPAHPAVAHEPHSCGHGLREDLPGAVTFPERSGHSVGSVVEGASGGRAGAVTAEAAPRRLSVLPPGTATVLGALGLVLIAAWVPLVYLTRDLQASRDGAATAFALVCGILGMLVARRQPRNPEGWLLLGLGLGVMVVFDSGLYAVLDYRVHDGRLPLGEAAVFLHDSLRAPLIQGSALVILLFPDGRLTRGWIWVMRAYLVLLTVATMAVVADQAGSIIGQPIHVDLSGSYSGSGGPSGGLGVLAALGGVGLFVTPLFWPAFVARQALSWRRASGDRRQQFKWLVAGAVCAVAGLLLLILGPPKDQLSGSTSTSGTPTRNG